MPIIKSAKKRVKVARKATIRNVKTKRTLKTALKSFQSSLSGSKSADAQRKAQSAIDKAAKKGVVHKNKAARQKRQLAAAAKKAGVKSGVKRPATTAKPTAKKPPAKKTVAKKPAAKKK